MSVIHLNVEGLPVTQGNLTAILPRRGDGTRAERPVIVEGRDKAARQRHRDWRNDVAGAARTWRQQFEPQPPLLDGPVAVRLHFRLLRARSNISRWPTGKTNGDVDKLTRSIFDALTGVLWRDDGQVVAALVTKVWGDPPGVDVFVDPELGERWCRWALTPQVVA